MVLAIEKIGYIIAVRNSARFIRRHAALLGGGVGVSRLNLLLDLVPGISAGGRAGHSCQDFPAAAAHLVAEQPTDNRADAGACQPIGVLGRLGARPLLVMAFLPRSLDRLDQRPGADDFGPAGLLQY